MLLDKKFPACLNDYFINHVLQSNKGIIKEKCFTVMITDTNLFDNTLSPVSNCDEHGRIAS